MIVYYDDRVLLGFIVWFSSWVVCPTLLSISASLIVKICELVFNSEASATSTLFTKILVLFNLHYTFTQFLVSAKECQKNKIQYSYDNNNKIESMKSTQLATRQKYLWINDLYASFFKK
jgi:hypothetical protein